MCVVSCHRLLDLIALIAGKVEWTTRASSPLLRDVCAKVRLPLWRICTNNDSDKLKGDLPFCRLEDPRGVSQPTSHEAFDALDHSNHSNNTLILAADDTKRRTFLVVTFCINPHPHRLPFPSPISAPKPSWISILVSVIFYLFGDTLACNKSKQPVSCYRHSFLSESVCIPLRSALQRLISMTDINSRE